MSSRRAAWPVAGEAYEGMMEDEGDGRGSQRVQEEPTRFSSPRCPRCRRSFVPNQPYSSHPYPGLEASVFSRLIPSEP